jgi:RND family efflux transporter MFP subunit
MVCLCLAWTVTARGEVEAFTRARHALQLAFTIPGKVVQVAVEPGDRVEEGDVLIRLNDEEIATQVALWQLRAESQVGRRVAAASLKMAQWEHMKVLGLLDKEAVSLLEVQRAEIQVEIEESRVAQAEEQREEAEKELARYESQLRRFTMKAPIAGVIEEITVSVGETVEQLKAVVLLVSTDPLWVDAPVPTEQTLALKVGDTAWVRSEISGYLNEPRQGRIIHIRSVADAASDTRLVRIELANPDGMPAGVQVTVSFMTPVEMARPDSDSTQTERR